MQVLDIITIILFSVGVLVTGISLSRSGKDLKGFFAGGGNIPWGISGLSLFMGFFSAGTFVVWGSIAYSYGVTAIVIQLTMAVAGFVVGTMIAPKWQRTGALTAAEYITENFGAGTQKAYTYIFLVVSVFTSGAFLYPVAKILEVAAGIPLTWSILASLRCLCPFPKSGESRHFLKMPLRDSLIVSEENIPHGSYSHSVCTMRSS